MPRSSMQGKWTRCFADQVILLRFNRYSLTTGGIAGGKQRDYLKGGLMAKRKEQEQASTAKMAPGKGRPTKAQASKAALAAKQPDLLDLLTKKPQATRTRAKKSKLDSE